MSIFKVKRGDTFALSCVATLDGAPLNLTGVSIRSQSRRLGTLVSEFSSEIINATLGEYVLRPTTPTGQWPLGGHKMDIEYSIGGSVIHTETFNLNCIIAETR